MSEAAENDVTAFYDEVQSDGGNVEKTSHGFRIYGFNVLVKLKKVEEKIGSIYIPDSHRERLEYSETEGELIAVSPVAFTYERWPEGTVLPQIGDMVTFAKYSGSDVDGNDGVKYRIMEDKEILAVKEK